MPLTERVVLIKLLRKCEDPPLESEADIKMQVYQAVPLESTGRKRGKERWEETREGEAELQLSQSYRGLKLGRPFRVPWIRDKGGRSLYSISLWI